MPLPTSLPKCLLLDFHHLGDAVMTFPAIRGLQGRYDVHVACKSSCVAVYRLLLAEQNIHAFDPPWVEGAGMYKRGPLGWIPWIRKAAKELRALEIDVSLSGWCDPRVDLLTAWARIPRRIGLKVVPRNYYVWRAFHLPSRFPLLKGFDLLGRLLAGGRLLTDEIVRADYRQHHRKDLEDVARAAGAEADYGLPWVRGGNAAKRKSEMLKGEGGGKNLKAGKPASDWSPYGRWLLHAGTDRGIKMWKKENWGELATRMREDLGLETRMILAPDMEEDEWSGCGLETVRTDTIQNLVDVLSRCDGLVCLDSFPAHLASAMGKQVVTLFGRQNPCWYAPFGNEKNVVTINDGRLDWRPPLLEEVTVEMVVEGVGDEG